MNWDIMECMVVYRLWSHCRCSLSSNCADDSLMGTSREGLRQVYDGRYKFLFVLNFGGNNIKKRGERSAGYGFTIGRETNPPQATALIITLVLMK